MGKETLGLPLGHAIKVRCQETGTMGKEALGFALGHVIRVRCREMGMYGDGDIRVCTGE